MQADVVVVCKCRSCAVVDMVYGCRIMSSVGAVINVLVKRLVHLLETIRPAARDASALTAPAAADRHHTSGQR